jgi:16S rRNA (guanine1516-N2)-methyltransferase
MSASFLCAVAQRRDDGHQSLCVVTTGNDRDVTAEARSRALVEQLTDHGGVRAVWASRYHTASRPATLTKLLSQHGADAVLVVDGNGTHLKTGDGSELRLHGGLGVLRVRNVLSGGNDNLVAAWCAPPFACMRARAPRLSNRPRRATRPSPRSGLREGDCFVDATAGQLQDALVAAAAVGASGRVVALEASPMLWAVTSGRPACSGDADIDRLLNERIEVRLGEHTALLRGMASGSADVVYFDPMFQRPTKSSSSFEVLRQLAHASRLSAEAVTQARRVARRAVVVMDQSGGAELERLGMRIIQSGQRKRFGVLDGGVDATIAGSGAV